MTTRDYIEVPNFSPVPAQQIAKPIPLDGLTHALTCILTHSGRELAAMRGTGLKEQAAYIARYKGQLEALSRLADVALYRVSKVENT